MCWNGDKNLLTVICIASLVYCPTKSSPLCQSREPYVSRKCYFSNRKWAFPDTHRWTVSVPVERASDVWRSACAQSASAGLMWYLQHCLHRRRFSRASLCWKTSLSSKPLASSSHIMKFLKSYFRCGKQVWHEKCLMFTVQKAVKGIKRRCASVIGVKLWNNIWRFVTH